VIDRKRIFLFPPKTFSVDHYHTSHSSHAETGVFKQHISTMLETDDFDHDSYAKALAVSVENL
jgi:hypothetical protein